MLICRLNYSVTASPARANYGRNSNQWEGTELFINSAVLFYTWLRAKDYQGCVCNLFLHRNLVYCRFLGCILVIPCQLGKKIAN